MSERDEHVEALDGASVLRGIRWAFQSAADRLAGDYSEAAGHDATWVGVTRFILLRDRLDRVFACMRYAVPSESDAAVSLDVLHAELSERDVATFPRVQPGVVVRSNLNGSPGWRWQETRWLLASAPYGKLDELPWPQKSPTKQIVAQQPNPDPDQASLFDDAEEPGLVSLLSDQTLAIDTLVVAHAQDADHGGRELVIGRPRLNNGGGPAWHWRHNLLEAPPTGGGRAPLQPPAPIGPEPVADAPVKLRSPASSKPDQTAEQEK